MVNGEEVLLPRTPKAMPAPCHFRLLMPTEQEAKKGVPTLGGISDPDCHEEMGLLIDNRIREEYVQNSGDSLGLLLVFSAQRLSVWAIVAIII